VKKNRLHEWMDVCVEDARERETETQEREIKRGDA